MDFKINNRQLPPPSNIRISFPKMQGHLLITWDIVRNPDQNNIQGDIINVMYNVYRGISAGGIFYKQNKNPLTTNIFHDINIGKNPNITYWYKVTTVYQNAVGQFIEGPFPQAACYQVNNINKWFTKMNERNMWILKNTGMLFDLYTRKYEGVQCPKCYDEARGRSGMNSCPVCFGTGFEGGYEPMMQIYMRLKPVEESLDITNEEYSFNSMPGAWTICSIQIKNRDLLIDPQGDMYQVTSSFVSHAAGYLFHQEIKLRGLEPEDKLYNIRRSKLRPEA